MPLGEARLRRPVSPQPWLAVRRCKTRRFEGGRRFLAAAAPELDGPGRPGSGLFGWGFWGYSIDYKQLVSDFPYTIPGYR